LVALKQDQLNKFLHDFVRFNTFYHPKFVENQMTLSQWLNVDD